MRDGICPKCGSDEVYSGAEVKRKTNGWGMNAVPIQGSVVTILAISAPLDNYVCGRCGYVESYIAYPEDLQRIVQEWPKVRS